MAQRGKRSRGLSDGQTGLLLGLGGIILIAALGGGYWFVKTSRHVLDSETNCPKSGPNGIHVILFDRSDPISEQQAQRIRQAIDKFKSEAPFGMRFDLYPGRFTGNCTQGKSTEPRNRPLSSFVKKEA